MNKQIKNIIRETKIRWKYHRISRILVNLVQLILLSGAFSLKRVYVGVFIFYAFSTGDIFLTADSEIERLLPISDRERQIRAILQTIIFSAKICIYVWIGMIIGNRSFLLSIREIQFLTVSFFLITSFKTSVARIFNTGDRRKGEFSIFRVISILADIATFILEAIAIGCLFADGELMQLLNDHQWNMLFSILIILFILAFVDDLRPWVFKDLYVENDSENTKNQEEKRS